MTDSAARSYDPRTANVGFDAELARLADQVEVSWAVERRRLEWLGVRDGMRILELGCGPGYVVSKLAAWLPAATIVGLDHDPELLRMAAEVTAGSGVRLVAAGADSTGLAGASFDLVLARYLYQHVPSPAAVAAEALRVLAPGGRHVAIDVDDRVWGIAQPAFPELRDIYARAVPAQEQLGGDRLRGAGLAQMLRAAGFGDAELDAFAYDSDRTGLAPFASQLSPDRLAPLVARGLLSMEDLALAHLRCDQFMERPDASVLLLGLIAWGDRPR